MTIVSCVGVVLCFLTDPVAGSGEEPQGQRDDYDLNGLREQEDFASEYFCRAGHVIFFRQELSESHLEGDAENGKKVTAYCLAMYQELELFEDSIEEKTFSYFPAALTFFVDADGSNVLEEFWKPQGAGSMEALKAALVEKFPMEAAEEVLEIIESSPEWSSGAGSNLTAHPVECHTN